MQDDRPASSAPREARPQAGDGRRRGRVDWMVVVVLTAAVAAVAALAVSLIVFARVREDSERQRMTATLAALWRFADEWGGDDMVAARSGAAAALLAERSGADVDEVLHFFDEIAFIWTRGAVDDELVWYHFYWPMVSYWSAAQAHVSRARAEDPALWKPLERLIERLTVIEAQHRHSSTAPTREQVRDFLTREVDTGACTDGQETMVRGRWRNDDGFLRTG